tara:strand:- start:7341 stop:7661 length:321 start_codon:yes stop_codon:yes gene_type:complete
MKFSISEKYTLISVEESTFYELEKQLVNFKSNHVIIELSENVNINDEKISLFLNISSDFKTNGMSFVVVKSGIDIDNFSESLNIAPTLQEAEDILEMEAIERDLGF